MTPDVLLALTERGIRDSIDDGMVPEVLGPLQLAARAQMTAHLILAVSRPVIISDDTHRTLVAAVAVAALEDIDNVWAIEARALLKAMSQLELGSSTRGEREASPIENLLRRYGIR